LGQVLNRGHGSTPTYADRWQLEMQRHGGSNQ
jgi:hypothetical protein